MFNPPVMFCCLSQVGSSFVDPFCYLCFLFVFVMLSFLLLVTLWSPGNGLTSWLSSVL